VFVILCHGYSNTRDIRQLILRLLPMPLPMPGRDSHLRNDINNLRFCISLLPLEIQLSRGGLDPKPV